jgi:hypothetical protein
MKLGNLATLILLACLQPGQADDQPLYYPPSPTYGPSQAYSAPGVALIACREAHFKQDVAIGTAIEDRDPDQILQVLRSALEVWRVTPETSDLYPARAFCIHELVPHNLPGMDVPEGSPLASQPTASVRQLREMGVKYWYDDGDRNWFVENPVDLLSLGTGHLNSRWGREAFLMMTKLGWSAGNCKEGPDYQFREVIRRGKEFLNAYPKSETSNSIRLEVANAYATWWTLSISQPRPPDFSPDAYKPGGEQARDNAIEIYQEYEKRRDTPNKYVENHLHALRDRIPLRQIDYFCEDYED